ncbi:sugar phosphate isomerase/epimerase [Opitutaceae bacterium TAV4]|nr:sugar phosphate isomerase/epimerase [Opitutaceae bacterium TAV4]RRK00685.1 sugar phosphate isomerase/epimerase [Opitutaceae bacterium TAV3]
MILHTFSTLGCPHLDLDAIIALAARHGIHALELRAVSGTTELPDLFAREYGTPAQLAAHLHRRNIRICSIDTSFSLIGAKDGDREQLIKFVEWADRLDVPWMRVFDGKRNGASESESIAEAADTLAWWRAERQRQGWAVDLMMETHGTFVNTPALQGLFRAAPHVSLLWDAHHTWRKGGEMPFDTWSTVRAHTVHVHVKDSVNEPTPDGKHPYTYVLPSKGEFPMQPLREQLSADRFDGFLSLEWERLWHPQLPELDKALYTAAQNRWW